MRKKLVIMRTPETSSLMERIRSCSRQQQEEDGGGPCVQGGAQPDQVAPDPAQLAHDHPHHLGPGGTSASIPNSFSQARM